METHVCIGIQARSTSSRLPNKISEFVGNKRVIEHVIDACENAARYLDFSSSRFSKIKCSVYVLIPEGDPVKHLISADNMIEGSEKDVLSRYVQMATKSGATHIVRITADCPLIPHFLISKCINTAIKNNLDYFSNVGEFVGESMRTSVDGHDVEVISAKALFWADQQAKTPEEREHVTIVLRDAKHTQQFSRGVLIGHNDHSDIKLSIDTMEDLMKVRDEYDKIQKKISLAKRTYGKSSVHRF